MKKKFAGPAALLVALAAAPALAQNCHWDFTVPTFNGTRSNDGFFTYQGDLHIFGGFRWNEGDPNRVARLTPTGWTQAFGVGFDPTRNLGSPNDVFVADNDLDVYFAGNFQDAGGLGIGHARGIARWDGSQWFAVPEIGGAFSTTLSAVIVWDDGTGDALYVGGNNTSSNSPGNRLLKWDGTTWSEVGGIGMGGWVTTLVEFQGDLYAFGTFDTLGDGTPVSRGAVRWDGTQFHSVGTSGLGVSGDALSGAIVWDDGTGEALYVYGGFAQADGITVNGLARWDGSSWSDVGGGLTRSTGAGAWVASAAIFDDGTGDALYVGSHNTNFFSYAGGIPAERFAKWDGTSWFAITFDVPNHTIFGMYRYDDPLTGEHALWLAGQFSEIGGVPANRIGRWVCDAPPPAGCYADCNDDGVLNIDDFLCFIDEFAQNTTYADCNDDGVHNIDDFLCFINEFAQGCP